MTARAAQANQPDQANELPDLYVGIRFEVEEIVIAYNKLRESIGDMQACFQKRQTVPLKLAAAEVSKVAGQIQNLSGHLASVCQRYVERRPR